MNDNRFSVKLKLRKQGEMKYFSQLDISSILERALRRAELPLYFTKGFTPRAKMSFSHALKLGVEGEIEVTLYFTEDLSAPFVCGVLSRQLPADLVVKPIRV